PSFRTTQERKGTMDNVRKNPVGDRLVIRRQVRFGDTCFGEEHAIGIAQPDRIARRHSARTWPRRLRWGSRLLAMLLRRVHCLLPTDVFRLLVLPESKERGVPQNAVAGPRARLDFGDE